MKCEACQPLLEEFFDGELADKTAADVAVHLKTCSSCAALLQQLTAEQQTYQGYERGVNVSANTWRQVEKRIAHRQVEPKLNATSPTLSERIRELLSLPRLSVPVATGLVLVAVVLTIVIMNYSKRVEPQDAIVAERQKSLETPAGKLAAVSRGDEVATPAPVIKERESIVSTADQPKAAPHEKRVAAKTSFNERSPAQLVREAEEKYLSAIALLTRDVERHPSSLDTQARAKFESALAAIDRTISATRVAVRQNPNDPVAVQYMLAAYRKKVDVLREMTSY